MRLPLTIILAYIIFDIFCGAFHVLLSVFLLFFWFFFLVVITKIIIIVSVIRR